MRRAFRTTVCQTPASQFLSAIGALSVIFALADCGSPSQFAAVQNAESANGVAALPGGSPAVGASPSPNASASPSAPSSCVAQTSSYQMNAIGSVPFPAGVAASRFGALQFAASDNNTLYISNHANYPDATLYQVRLQRNSSGHITGFRGQAQAVAQVPYIDGGLIQNPSKTGWMYSTFDVTQGANPHDTSLAQITAQGSTWQNLASWVGGEGGGLQIVPSGYPGAGRLKWLSWAPGVFTDLSFNTNGNGTLAVTGATQTYSIYHGQTAPTGFAYVPLNSPCFQSAYYIIVSEWSLGTIASFQVDTNGNPIASTRDVLYHGLDGPEGALFDPVTGDMIFSTWPEDNATPQILVFQGFAHP